MIKLDNHTVIGIIGSRRRDSKNDEDEILGKFLEIVKDRGISHSDVLLCSGGCPKGGDRVAELIGKRMGLPILIFYPNWKEFGRKAGFVRNTEIAMHSDILIACVAKDRKGGTEDTIKKFGVKSKKLFIV